MACKMLCLQVKAGRPKDGVRYDNEQARCNPCDIFILHKDCVKDIRGVLRCPCCKHRVRRNPRSRQQKMNRKKRLEQK